MTTPPYASARRVFWIVDNGSSHRGQPSVDRLQSRWPSLRLIHLPIPASWLNQVEIYFSVVQRKLLTPNDFHDLDELETRLLAGSSMPNAVRELEAKLATHTVGAAANPVGVSAKAIRIWEAKGLLPPATRTEAGYRWFSGDDIAILRFILRAKTLGLTLPEIKDILDLHRQGTAPCDQVTALLDKHIRDIDRAIADLRALRTTLAAALQSAPSDQRRERAAGFVIPVGCVHRSVGQRGRRHVAPIIQADKTIGSRWPASARTNGFQCGRSAR